MKLFGMKSNHVFAISCYNLLATLLGGEWTGDEWIVQTFIAGLKVDLAESLV